MISRALSVLAASLLVLSCERASRTIGPDNAGASSSAVPAASVAAPPREVRHLVVRSKTGKPLSIDGCLVDGRCVEWARYPAHPPRDVIRAEVSRTGDHFHVWSKADGTPRELDVFAIPNGASSATRTAHLKPGFGGELQWVEGERLFHWWGCGAPCAVARVYDTRGAVLHESGGSAVGIAPSAKQAAVTDHGGKVVLFDFVDGTMVSARYPGATWPAGIEWQGTQLVVSFETAATPIELRCTRSGTALRCAP